MARNFDEWIVDYGALEHMCYNLTLFHDYRTIKS